MRLSQMTKEQKDVAGEYVDDTAIEGLFRCLRCDRVFKKKGTALTHVFNHHYSSIHNRLMTRHNEEAKANFWDVISRRARMLCKTITETRERMMYQWDNEKSQAENVLAAGNRVVEMAQWELQRLTSSTTELDMVLQISEACREAEEKDESLFDLVALYRNEIVRRALSGPHNSSSTNPVVNAINLFKAGSYASQVDIGTTGFIDELLHLASINEGRKAEWRKIKGLD